MAQPIIETVDPMAGFGGGESLRPVPVQASVNDGTTTAITGGELKEGARVVTGAAQPAPPASPAPASGWPLVPQRPRRPGSGGAR